MPELPDVQVFKEYLDATSLHQRIEAVELDASRVLKGVSARALTVRLKGHELESARRHGKHLFAQVSGGKGWLRLHFGMTGSLAYFKDAEQTPDHSRLRLDFSGDDYHLAYVNVRRFGEIGWVDDVDDFIAEQGLGPDALALDRDGFAAVFEGRRGTLKGALMNQALLAGVGNVYADETLFQAGFDPSAKVERLKPDSLSDLHRAMTKVLRAAIDGRVEHFPDWFMLPHRDGDMRCPHCGGRLKKTKVSGRATYSCPKKQTRAQ